MPPPTVTPGGYCSTQNSYAVDSTVGQQIDKQGPIQTDYNGTDSNATMSLSKSTTGTAQIALSVGGSFDIDAIIAGAQATTSLALSYSQSYGLANTITITVPPHEYGNGTWGDWRWVTRGTYYTYGLYCKETSATTMTTYVPSNHVGWDTWITG